MQARDSLLAYFTVGGSTGTSANDFSNFMVRDSRTDTSGGSGSQTIPIQPLVLQPKSGSRTVYMAGIVGPDSDTPTFTGATGVICDGAVTLGASATVTVKTVSALLHFKVGDTVVDVDDNVVGIIESLLATSIVFTAVTTHAVADDEELFTPHSLVFKLDIEY